MAENTVRQPPGSCGSGWPKAAPTRRRQRWPPARRNGNRSALLPEFAGSFAPPIPPLIGPPRLGISTAGQLPKTNSFATAGLIFGILSVTCFCCCPFNVLGLVFSLIGWSQINRHPELYEGRGLAITGLILSAASLVLGFGLAMLNLALHPENLEWHFKTF